MSHLVQAHRVHRSIYTEPEIFDQEMAKIFGGTWVYVAHESQIPEPNDFITTHLGRRELIVTRDRDGQLRALFNRCSHRASTVCQQDQGSAEHFQCSYHGWTYSNGNWKLAWDNAADGAHPTFAHRSFVLLNERQHGGTKSLSQFKNAPDETEMYGEDLGNGHLFIDQRPGLNSSFWQAQRPIPGQEPYQERLVEEFGDTAPELLDLAAGSMVNLSIFPNLLLKGNHVEVVDPVRVDRTRLHTWMVAAVGVPEEVNVLRMRIAEDFPSLGNPDDPGSRLPPVRRWASTTAVMAWRKALCWCLRRPTRSWGFGRAVPIARGLDMIPAGAPEGWGWRWPPIRFVMTCSRCRARCRTCRSSVDR